LIVAYRNGAPIRLQDVAQVIDSVEDDKTASFIYGGQWGKVGTQGVSMNVMRQPGTNTIEVTDAIKALLPVLQSQMPPAVRLSIRGDRSKNIREAFQDVQLTLMVTLGLVIMVIFLFLRNLSATMIPAMALPFSVVGTFSVMYMLNFSLNNISMMALILSVGFVVDDAIVMLENIVRHIEKGEAPYEAALAGSKEIGFTIVSMTLSLAAVFIPILFMAGILGRLFREFAVTICTAILISGMVSISLTPMLCSRFLRGLNGNGHGRAYRFMERIFNGMLRFYAHSLHWVLQRRAWMMATFVVVLAATAYLYVIVPKGFIPDTDNDNFNIQTEAAQGTSYYQMIAYQRRVAAIVAQDPDVDNFFSSAGGSFNGASQGRIMLNLKPRRERVATVGDIVNRLRPRLSNIPGLRVYLTIPQAIRVGGRMSKSSYDFTLYGPDTAQLYEEALKSSTGQLVPIDAVAKLTPTAGPPSIPHSGQLQSVTVSFALRPGTSLGQATSEIEDAARANLPATIRDCPRPASARCSAASRSPWATAREARPAGLWVWRSPAGWLFPN
jgi:HAE1 family hydrophobic/amphiphilic exporter-1